MKCKIVAEIGWNHCGNITLAKEMASAAIECGADFVKFQTWSVENLKEGDWDDDGRREIYTNAELSRENHIELYDYVTNLGSKFLTSLFCHKDLGKLPFCYNDYIKIPSCEIANYKLLAGSADRFAHLIISTGASTEQEVMVAYNMCLGRCTLLHCVSAYPCLDKYANLSRIGWLKTISPLVGYSDHTQGIAAPAYAMSHGCSIVEKHFTIDHNLPGRDNKFAVTPDILKQICDIRDCINVMTKPLGNEYQECEKDVRDVYRGRWAN